MHLTFPTKPEYTDPVTGAHKLVWKYERKQRDVHFHLKSLTHLNPGPASIPLPYYHYYFSSPSSLRRVWVSV